MTLGPAFGGPGEMAGRMRDFDWPRSPLGEPSRWPASLRSVVTLMLDSGFPMFLAWGARGHLLYNDAYIALMGQRHPAGFCEPISEVWFDAWKTMAPFFDRALAGESLWLENLALRTTRHGRTEDATFTLTYSPARDDEGRVAGVFCAVVETTSQVRADFEMRQLAQTLEARVERRTEERNQIWQVSRDMLLVADTDGTWLSINPAWTACLGWTEEELVGRTSEWMEHPDDQARTRAEIGKLAEGQTTPAFENRCRTRTGEYRNLSWTAVLSDERIYATARDVTEERRQTAALIEQTSQLRLYGEIIQASEAPICAFDTGFRLIAFNRAHSDEVHRMLAHRVTLGDVFPDLFPPGQAAALRGLMARALAGEAYTATEEFGAPGRAPSSWELSYSPLRDPQGRVIGAFHYAKDITPRLRAAAELATMQEALRQSQKMEAVGQLTGGLAHDFNNLLAGITGSLELIQTRMRQGRHGDVERYVAAAQGAAKRAAALTHRLLAFSRRQTLDPKPTDVNRLVAGLQELIQRTVGPAIAIEVVGAAGSWPILVDPPQLENALLNLCINARDAMPDGGRITIETANRWLDARTARRTDLPEGHYLALSVSDTGTGMPPEVVARVFEPFYTTKPIGEGTGLGLSMIYGFAQQSGGQVRIHSQVGQGTTVSLFLPRHHGTVADDTAAGTAAALPRSEGGETVLVVDDEPTVRMLVTDILQDLGYNPIEAGDGAAGLQILRSDVRVDLLVTDVGLPGGMNGRQLADAARVGRPGLKVLFITGYAENALLGGGKLAGGMAVLTKPFAVEAMAARIRAMVETGNGAARRSNAE